MRAVVLILTTLLFFAAQPAYCEGQIEAEAVSEQGIPVATAPKAKISPLMQQIAKERSLSQQQKATRPPAFQPFGTLTSKNTVYFLMLAFGALFVARKMQQQKGSDPLEGGIQVLSRRALGAKTALLIVDAQGERFLLSQTGEDIQLVSPLELSTYSALTENASTGSEPVNLKEVNLSSAGGKSVAV